MFLTEADIFFISLNIVVFVFSCLYLAAWVMTMLLMTKVAEEKGYGNIKGQLWFIGLFALVFTVPLIVAALPDKTGRTSTSTPPSASPFSDLPEV